MIFVSPSLFHFLYFALLLRLLEKVHATLWVQDDLKLKSHKNFFPVKSSTTPYNCYLKQHFLGEYCREYCLLYLLHKRIFIQIVYTTGQKIFQARIQA